MRSEIAKRIMAETPKEVKDFVRSYGNEVVERRNQEIAVIRRNLTPEEIESALLAYSCTKWHRIQGGENPSFKAGDTQDKINIVK